MGGRIRTTAAKAPGKSELLERLTALEKERDDTRAELEHERQSKAKLQGELEDARKRNPPAASPPADLASLGPPPDDPLAGTAYAHRVMMISLYDAAKDDTISSRERRKELRTIAAAAAKLVPRSRVHKAEQIVLGNKAELEIKAREQRTAKLEKRPRPHGQEPKQ